MERSYPKCSQAGNEFVITTNDTMQEEIKPISTVFPIAIYTQQYDSLVSDYIPPHWHDVIQITWVAKGELTCYINGNNFVLEPGKLVIIADHQLHSFRTKDYNTKTLCINFSTEVFHPLIWEQYLSPVFKNDAFSYSVLSLGTEEQLFLKQLLKSESQELGYFPVMNFLSHLFETFLYRFQDSKESGSSIETEHFHKILTYVHTHYAEGITVADLSDFALMNRNKLTNMFRKYTGMPPLKYLNEYRLYKAKEMLTGSDLSIQAISEEAGYRQVSYFIEQFRKKFGLSPLKYRNAYQADAIL